VAGSIDENIPRNSVDVFRFDLNYSLSQDLTERVSDHYPIQLQLQGKETIPPLLYKHS